MPRQIVRALFPGFAVMAAAACLTACAQTATATPAGPAPSMPTPTSPTVSGAAGPLLLRIGVTVGMTTLPSGATQSLHAIGVFEDGNNTDVTDLVTWQSSDPRVAMVDVADAGVTLYAGDAGAADVTATLGPVHGAVHVTIAAALRSIVLSPGTTHIAPCGARQLTAIGSFSDGTQHDVTALATWSTSDATIATAAADGPRGVIVAMAPGTVTVTASWGAVAGALTLVADPAVPKELAVSPTNLTVTAGQSVAFTATATACDGTVTDATMSATWISSTPMVASIDDVEAGAQIATTTAAGSTWIAARLGDLSDAIRLDVAAPTLQSLFVSTETLATTMSPGDSLQLAANGAYSDGSFVDVSALVTWSSSDPTVATVSPSGLMTAVACGSVTMTAELEGSFGSLAIDVVTP